MTKGELTTAFGGGKVAIKGNAAALAAALDNDLEETGEGQASGGSLYLNFSGKLGKYSLGKQRDEIDPEDFFAIMPESSTRGWVCWKNSKPIKRHRWAVGQPGVAEEELEEIEVTKDSDGWKMERAFLCRSLEEGKMIEFSTTSASGRNSVGDLLGAVSERVKGGEDEAFYPIITFASEEFTAQGEKNFKPVFVIVGWASQEQLIAYGEGELELDDLLSEEEEAPVKKESKAKKKSAPKRRRAAL